jgi:ATP-binding cassette subfamily C (CFTR/MRP) protein 1
LKTVVREEFKDCTILTVVHGLETILEADVIAVLDGGAPVEFGVPEELMKEDLMLRE